MLPAVTAGQLCQEREANATRYDDRWKGERVLVTGEVEAIEDGDVRLKVGDFEIGYVALRDLPRDVQVSVNTGQTITALCTVGDYVILEIQMRNCELR